MFKSVKYLRSVGLTSLLMLSLVLPAIVIPSAASAAVQSVTVDLNPNNGSPTYRGSGFLYGLSENGSAPAGALLSDLKPKMFRGGGAGLNGGAWAVGGYTGYLPRFNSVLAQYNRANALGAKYQILVSDVWGSDCRTIPDLNQPVYPGDNGNWASWNSFVTQLVNDKKANNMANATYDIWNEPGGYCFWPRSVDQYYEMWKKTVLLIRSLDPNAVIVGPGYGIFVYDQISAFLNYAKANNVLPDVLDWHFSNDPVADVQTAKDLLLAKNITSITKFSIGEYIWADQQNAGYTAWYLARLEKSGVVASAHAIWDHCCDQGLLDDILTPSSQKKGQWWTYKAYADMSGTLVGTTASANIDGVASKDSVKQSALILLGNKGGVTGDIDVNVINFNTAAYLIGSGKAHVVVSWINNIDPVAAPIVTQTLDATVVNNAIKVTIPWNYASDAYTIAITPYNPSQPTPTPTATPGNVYQAEDASLTGGAKIMTDHTGYTGTGFVAGYEFQGPATTFMVNAASQGNYNLELRYANGSGSGKTLSVYVNGTKIRQTSLAATANWDAWGTKSELLSLSAGYNIIAYKYDAGDSGLVNLDKITLSSSGTPTPTPTPTPTATPTPTPTPTATPAGNVYQAENAAIAGGAKIMTDHTGYTGTGFIAGYEFQGPSTTFTINVANQGSHNVELRYANGTSSARTISIYVNGTKIRQTSLANLANWDTWGTKVEALTLNAGNNTIMYKYDSGDSGTVNLDKITVS